MKLALGTLSATQEGLALRWLRRNDVELLRGVAFVVRDTNWGTYPPVVEVVSHEATADRLALHLRGTLASPRLVCEVRITLDEAGLVLEGSATAGEDFTTNRTGFVVLHGEQCAGLPLAVEHGDHTTERGAFPTLVSPHQPFLDVHAVTHAPAPGVAVRVEFEGDTFEMEDHRNWSDAGFKTYCRPLARPVPYVLVAGTTLAQRVIVTLARAPRLAIGAPAARWRELPADAALLLAETATGTDLAGFAGHLAATGRPGAVLLAGTAPRHAAIDAVAAAGPWEALLIANATADAVAHARERMPGAKVGAGSDLHFAEFNRCPPPPGIDFAFWGVTATAHATDDASVMETLRVLADQARTARALVPGVPLWVGPIGIGARWQADPRDDTPFGAAFLRGQVEAWGAAGIDTLIVPAGRPIPELG